MILGLKKNKNPFKGYKQLPVLLMSTATF